MTIDKAGNLRHHNGRRFEREWYGFQALYSLVAGGAWTEDILYSFGTGTDGTVPVGGVTLDAYGDLYGTTQAPASHR
ncbi:MAG: hypothetical protein WA485_25405 [Candidatus Sulfotelmatobacter sp.]